MHNYKLEDNDESLTLIKFKKSLNDNIINNTSFSPLLENKNPWNMIITLDESWKIHINHNIYFLKLGLWLTFFIITCFILTQSILLTFLMSLFFNLILSSIIFWSSHNKNKIINKNLWYLYPQRFQVYIDRIILNINDYTRWNWVISFNNEIIYDIKKFYAIQIINSLYNWFEINIVLNKINEEGNNNKYWRVNIWTENKLEKAREKAKFLKDNLNLPIWDTSEL